jgi:sulfur-oxidizing protein SoxZ
MLTVRLLVPPRARKGDVIEIKTLVVHPMETGYRRDNVGRAIPRFILTRFTCTYAGAVVFASDMFTGVAANPFMAFHTVATETGELVFEWTDQNGAKHTERRRIEVA